MTIIVDETYSTKVEKTRQNQWKWTREFIATNIPEAPIEFAEMFAYTAIRTFITQRYPVYSHELIHSLEVSEIAPETWKGVCQFTSPTVTQKLKLDRLPEYSFSTKGGTAHITESRKTVKEYAGYRPIFEEVEISGVKKYQYKRDEEGKILYEHDDIPNLNRGIGWNPESATFDGVDIQVSSWKSTARFTVPDSYVDQQYLRMLRWLTCTVNSVSFDGMHPGECLFVGCDGTRKAVEVTPPEDSENPQAGIEYEWNLSFDFLGSPNATKWIEGIGYVKKNGWDYMHQLRRTVDYPQEVVKLPDEPEDYDPPITGEFLISDQEDDDISDRFNTREDATTQATPTAREALKYTITAPMAVYIEQVYPYADFRVLGFF
jgi:hypothetical protein